MDRARGLRNIPDELASEAGRLGKAARAASNRAICAGLTGSSGNSDETKWLISRSAPLAAPCVSIAARSRVQRFEAEPVHAGVEMQRARASPPALRGEGGPARELLLAADDRREAVARIVRRFRSALEAVEHVDRRLGGQEPARRDPLAQMGDEEDARAGRPQRRRGLGEADPVSVGLDDGGAPPGRGAAGELAPVVGQRAKVDREPPRRGLKARRRRSRERSSPSPPLSANDRLEPRALLAVRAASARPYTSAARPGKAAGRARALAMGKPESIPNFLTGAPISSYPRAR